MLLLLTLQRIFDINKIARTFCLSWRSTQIKPFLSKDVHQILTAILGLPGVVTVIFQFTKKSLNIVKHWMIV